MAQKQFGTTSFIPKKPQSPVAGRKRGGVINIFFLISLIVFLGALTVTVGVFLYEGFVKKNIAEKSTQLEQAREAFEPTLIEELSKLDVRMQSAQEILDSHVALSAFFELLERSTLKSVRFNSFANITSPEGRVGITMKGTARSFNSVALQSDVFGKDPFIRDPLFSNLNLDDLGNVIFDFSATLDPDLLSYRQIVDPLTQK